MEELNIEDNLKQLVVKALCSSKNIQTAARRLRITERTLYNYIARFKIEFKYAVWEIKNPE